MKPIKNFLILILPLFLLLLTVFFVLLFKDSILVASIGKFTPCRVSYSEWKGNPFSKSVVRSCEIRIEKAGIGARASEAEFFVDPERLFKGLQLFVKCSFRDTAFFLTDTDEDRITNILDLISSRGQVFEKVSFDMTVDKHIFSITSLSATSSDIIMKGDVFMDKQKNTVSIDITFSVSPSLAAGAGEELKKHVLSLQEDGWFGASISYRGNPDFLRALYFAVSPTG